MYIVCLEDSERDFFFFYKLNFRCKIKLPNGNSIMGHFWTLTVWGFLDKICGDIIPQYQDNTVTENNVS